MTIITGLFYIKQSLVEVKDQILRALPASHRDLFHNRNEEQDWQERAIRLINSKIIRKRKRPKK